MAYEDLQVVIADGVAELVLDRPAHRNAFSGPMAESLSGAYRECDARDDVRAVVLTGAGTCFCVGADFAAGVDTFARRQEPEFSADPIAFPASRHRPDARHAVRHPAGCSRRAARWRATSLPITP